MNSIRYVLQGRNQCGQACVASLLDGISLEEAIKLVGKRGCTRGKDIDSALRKGSRGRLRLAKRLRGGPQFDGANSVWLVAVHLKPKTRGWHWAVVRLNGLGIDVVWPTMYPQHVRGLLSSRKSPALVPSGWPPQAKITQSWKVLGAA